MAQKVVFRVSYPLCGILDWGEGWLKAELERRTIDLWQGQPGQDDTSVPWEVKVEPDGQGYTVSVLVPSKPMDELITKCATAIARDPENRSLWLRRILIQLDSPGQAGKGYESVLRALEIQIHRRLVTGHW